MTPFGDPRLPKRFWSKVTPGPNCWLWTACSDRNGYGMFHLDGRMRLAHRVAYAALAGPIGDLDIDHKCRMRGCVNPAHLQAVTTKENGENRDAIAGSISGVRGVRWRPDRGFWFVRVTHNGKTYYGGSSRDLAEAERAAIALRNRLFTNNILDWEEAS